MIRTLRKWWTKRATKSSFGLNDDRLATFLSGPAQSVALGESVTPESALTLSDYYAAIRNISEDVAKLPFKVYRQLEPRGKAVQPDNPIHTMLHSSPNPEMSAFTFRETINHWAMGWGNGYAEIERNGAGAPIALWPIHPSRVQLLRAGGNLFGEIRLDNGSTGRIPYSDLLHIKGLGNGYLGYSVVRLAAESIGHGQALERFGASYFGHGAAVGLTFTFPQAMTDRARTAFREQITAQREGLANAHRSLVLENGGDVKQSSIPPEESQFIETRQLSVEVLCRWFRIPPHKVQHLLRATFSNIEAQNTEYVTDTLMPWLVRWEQEVNRKLLAGQPGIFAEHTVNALLRGDMAARGAFYSQMSQIGAVLVNEIRDFEGLNPIPGGDVAMVQGALVPLLEAQKPKQPAPVIVQQPPGEPDEEGEEPTRAMRIAGIAAVFAPAIADELMRNYVLSRNKVKKGAPIDDAFGVAATQKAERSLGTLLVTMAGAITQANGRRQLTAGTVRPIMAGAIAQYLERCRHAEQTGLSEKSDQGLEAWIAAESLRIAELIAGEVWNVMDAEVN